MKNTWPFAKKSWENRNFVTSGKMVTQKSSLLENLPIELFFFYEETITHLSHQREIIYSSIF